MDDNAYMELETRTLVVRNFDSEQTTKELLEELFSNFGPVKKIVLKFNLAYIEYTDKNSVGYAMAMLAGVCLHGRRLNLQPKIRHSSFFKHMDSLQQFYFHCKDDKNFMDKFLSEEQKQEKSSIVDDYFKSHHKKKRIEERLRRFRKHCDPIDCNFEFNPYFGKNLIERDYEDDRGGGYNHSNSPRTNRRHYEPPPYHQDHSNDYHRHRPIEPPPPQIPPPMPHQPSQFHDNRYPPTNQVHRIPFPDYHSNHPPPPPPLLQPPQPFHGHNDRYPEPFQREFDHHHHHHHHRRHHPYASDTGHHRQNQGWRPNYR